MADSTSVLIKHNLNVDNIEEFKSALEKVLDITIEHTIIINNDEAITNQPDKGCLCFMIFLMIQIYGYMKTLKEDEK